MEGPYRDLGGGFARLTGAEGARRGPSRIVYVEDALLELLRNARDAGARNVYVASTLHQRRYRTLTVLDDGHGIPDPYRDLVFEPGVTTRHLSPVIDPHDPAYPPHGAGLSLYHIEQAALEARVHSASNPTSIGVTFDTRSVPERTLQSASRPSRTNLLATLQHFATAPLNLYYGPPAPILANLLRSRIIQNKGTSEELRGRAKGLGLGVSVRTIQRIRRGEIGPAGVVTPRAGTGGVGEGKTKREAGDGPVLALGERERAGIEDILRRAARENYLEFGGIQLESRPGEIAIKGRVYEPEEEYEQ